jgi:hypothetical protein
MTEKASWAESTGRSDSRGRLEGPCEAPLAAVFVGRFEKDWTRCHDSRILWAVQLGWMSIVSL